MVVQLIHPRHRDAARHRPAGAGGGFYRTWAVVSEPFLLGGGKRHELGLIHPRTPPCSAGSIVDHSMSPRAALVDSDPPPLTCAFATHLAGVISVGRSHYSR